jgi:phage tail-like protein
MTFDNGLYNWFNEASGSRFELGSKMGRSTLARQNVAITLMSAKGKRLRTWILTDAIPVSWKGPELSIETDEFLVEEITLAHHGLVSSNMGLPAGSSKKPSIKALKKVVAPKKKK